MEIWALSASKITCPEVNTQRTCMFDWVSLLATGYSLFCSIPSTNILPIGETQARSGGELFNSAKCKEEFGSSSQFRLRGDEVGGNKDRLNWIPRALTLWKYHTIILPRCFSIEAFPSVPNWRSSFMTIVDLVFPSHTSTVKFLPLSLSMPSTYSLWSSTQISWMDV